MNRLIKFRGKDISGKWRFGDLIHYRSRITISETKVGLCGNYEVIPESVGQFTGFKDIDDNEIFEGDIIKINGYPKTALFIIEYIGTAFIAKCTNPNYRNYPLDHFANGYEIEVIGNIFDNPDLLEAYNND